MEFIRGVNFAPFAPRGALTTRQAQESLEALPRELAANTVFLCPCGVQRTAHSTQVDFSSERTTGDEELAQAIRRAHALGMRVALKPTVNCLDGVWRAHVCFFDHDVPGEPTWGEWFASYTAFQQHFARIAQREGAEWFLPGCEMVMAERREDEWRALIAALRAEYGGQIAYNCDKYQEDRVHWWDCLDAIASSGYYPLGDWEQELARIEAVSLRFGKPFFFAEMGCMATSGASARPNDWSREGEYAPGEQLAWYEEMLSQLHAHPFVRGYALWDWQPRPPISGERGYNLRGTQACALLAQTDLR